MSIGFKKASGGTGTTLDQQRLLALVNSMTDGFLALSEKTEIVLCNSAALSLLDENNLQGKTLNQVLRLVDSRGKPITIQKILPTSGSTTSDEWKLLYADNSNINLFISASTLHTAYGDKSEGGWVVIFRDITRQKQIEQERDEFVSVASHELRTPVAIAEGSISNGILLADRGGVNDTIKHSLAAAHDQIIFLSNLINDLSMLSKAERGAVGMEIEEFSPAGLATSLAADYERMASKKKLIIRADAEKTGTVRNSSLYVREILQNFVTNAIKYTQKGSVTIIVKPKENGVEFSVTDTGIGINKSEQSKLFEKFYRSSDWRVREVNGTGLGLYVTAKLTKAISGVVTVSSEAEKGSTFSLYVPDIPEQQPVK